MISKVSLHKKHLILKVKLEKEMFSTLKLRLSMFSLTGEMPNKVDKSFTI